MGDMADFAIAGLMDEWEHAQKYADSSIDTKYDEGLLDEEGYEKNPLIPPIGNKSTNKRNLSIQKKKNKKKLYTIAMYGCDDTTFFDITLSKEEFELMQTISAKSEEISTSMYMPTLLVTLSKG